MRAILICLLSLLPALANASCNGTNIAGQLPPERLAAAEAAAQAQPYARGNHWIARKGGQTIHVIGTLHVSDPRMDAVMDRLAPLAARTGKLYLESTIAQQEAFQASLASDTSKIFLKGATLIDLMSGDDWQQLTAALETRGIPAWMAAKMKPWFLSTLLAIPPCLMADTASLHGLDRRLSAAAQAAGVPVASLEHPDILITLMDSAPIEQQISQLTTGLAALSGGEDGLATVTEAYFAERAPLAMEVLKQAFLMDDPDPEDIKAWDDVVAALLDQRNRAWIKVIRAETEPRFMIAAGAGHLAGASGLLNLLAQDGYLLEAAAF